MRRSDFSMYLVHFSKDGPPISASRAPAETNDIVSLSARDRLLRILEERRVRATRMPWTNKRAICLTECTWASLFAHAAHYSPYGVGFRKEFIFAAGGAPAIYMPPALLERQKAHVGEQSEPFDEQLFSFLTPFAPTYMPSLYRETHWPNKKSIDFSHEREWRVPHDLHFDLQKVCFVIVESHEDLARIPIEIRDAVGKENWLVMTNWQRVEEFWPTNRG
jgi:hypothetical protein